MSDIDKKTYLFLVHLFLILFHRPFQFFLITFISLHINASVNKNVGGFSSYYYPKTSHDARVATAIQKRMTNSFGLDDLGIRQANFYVNKRSSMPSALIEMAFITNAKEEKLLNSNWFQSKLAKAIADGFDDYFKLCGRPIC